MKFLEFQVGAWQVSDDKAQVILFGSPIGGIRQPITVASNATKLHADFETAFADLFNNKSNAKQRIRNLGEQLAQIILPPAISKMLMRSMERISPSDGIRIRLCLDESLIDLPWEYIVAPEIDCPDGFLILNSRISLVREAPLISKENTASMQKQRLVFAGTFWHDGSDTWNVNEEFQKLKTTLEKDKNIRDLIGPEFIPSSGNNIQLALPRETEIFHYSGHVDQINGRGYLIKEMRDDVGASDKLYSDTLAIWLRKSGTRLAMFSACNSGRWFFVKPLIDAGIPIIIGAYSTITTNAAIAFCDKLYQTLAIGMSLDEAITWARTHIKENEQSQTELFEWGSFMVYMPTEETVIFPRPVTSEVITLQNAATESRNQTIANVIGHEKGPKEPEHLDYCDLSIRVQDDGDILALSDQGEWHGELNLDQKEIGLAMQRIEKDAIDEEFLKKLGTTLFNALFDKKIFGGYIALKVSADQKGCGVRLRLIFEKPEMAVIPWEFLYDDSTNTFLANDRMTALSRYIDLPLKKQDIKPASLPLKILLVVSSPKNLDPLDSDREIELIKKALQDHIKSGQIEIDTVPNTTIKETEIDTVPKATIKEIDQKLSAKPYNVFHFIGHGIFQNDKGHLALMDDNDNAKFVDDQTFADLFLGKRGLGLAILNSCEGAEVSSSQVFTGMAPRLVQRGIPAVIAMQYSIEDSTALLFADKFYRSLALAKPVDEAVQETRNLIFMESGRDKRDFATPVLYMRAKDGIILNLAGKDPAEKSKYGM